MNVVRIDYHQYIRSTTWQEKRKQVLQRDGYACRVCNVSGYNRRLHVHHRTYNNLNRTSEIQDCVTLCENCHRLYHQNGVTTR